MKHGVIDMMVVSLAVVQLLGKADIGRQADQQQGSGAAAQGEVDR